MAPPIPKQPEEEAQAATTPAAFKFLAGGASGIMGTSLVHPLDLIKNRMQLPSIVGNAKEYGSMLHALRSVIANEGPRGLYRGLSAALARQATYTTTRLGVYGWLFDKYSSRDGHPTYLGKVLCGMTAGVCGALAGNPTDLALVRMSSDGRLPPELRRNYRNVLHALVRIGREEGVLALWRGTQPFIARAMVINVAQLATYSQAKEVIASQGYEEEGAISHAGAAVASALVTSCVSLPIDIVKTRIQTAHMKGPGSECRGIVKIFVGVIREEGPLALWTGFYPYFIRMSMYTIVAFTALEKINAMYREHAKSG